MFYMGRRPTPSVVPQPPLALTVSRSEAFRRIGKRITSGKELEDASKAIRTQSDLDYFQTKSVAWDEYNEELLKQLFTNSSVSDEYNTAYFGVIALDDQQVFENLKKTHARRISKLESIQERLELYLEPSEHTDQTKPSARSINMSKVFIVHGHDETVKQGVARYIENLGFTATILHERPNKGRTIITKFQEEAADAGFAVVLMTPDDLGKAKDAAELKPRARQNVVFELAFFIGALGSNRVAALVKGEIEKPSDFDGVVYLSLDAADWKVKLAHELEAAGYSIDWKKAAHG